MNRIVITILFFACFQIVNGQPWHPFPGDQISYYKHPVLDYDSKEILLVERYCNDSLWIESEQQYVHYLSGSTLRNECFWDNEESWILNNFWFSNQYGDIKLDHFVNMGDSMMLAIYYYPGHETWGKIVFKPWVKAGESWVTNGRKIKCTAAGVKTILGIQDSVKYFDCELADNTKSILILSKNYGLIKFMPFKLILNTNFEYKSNIELIGFKNETQQTGYQLPEFSDYFHLNAGDVLFWEDEAWVGQEMDKGFINDIHEIMYHKDSIISSEIGTDTVKYHYHRTIFDSRKRFVRSESAMDIFTRSNEGVLVANQPGWFGTLNNNVFGDYYSQVIFSPKTELVVSNNDTTTKNVCVQMPVGFDSEMCFFAEVADYPEIETHFSTKEGIIRKPLSWIGEGETFKDTTVLGTEIIGSIINGKTNGIVLKSTSNQELLQTKLQLWPNPVEDILNIKNIGNNASCIELYDMNGRLVKESANTNHLVMKGVPSGIYLVKVWDSDSVCKTARILKK
ncbi:MAG: T9SS type A sorting domain-containing protein [Prolixibacteraceae bacterium]|nr:T9SS type A sorting domain-containing protein [Prolixibacteraceae bacterium]